MTLRNRLITIGGIMAAIALVLAASAAAWLGLRPATVVSAQDKGGTNAPAPVETAQFTVRGSGIITGVPNVLKVTVGVNLQDATVQAAQNRATPIMNAIVEKLKAGGIAEGDYRTAQYSIEPVMDYGTDKGGQQEPKLVGFRVINMLEVTIRDTARAPQLLDDMVSAGANTIFNLSYTFFDPSALSKQAYDGALKDAADKAQRMATLSNLTLGRIVSVSEASANVPVYDKGMGGGGGGGVFPGVQQVQVDLIVTYEATVNK